MSDTPVQPSQQGEDKTALLQNPETGYDPLASPPDLTIALKHQTARRVGKSDVTVSAGMQSEYCPCCSLPVKNEPLPICGSRLDLAELGAGFPLYFEYVFFCGVLLALLFAITGVYNLIANNSGEMCTYWSTDSTYPCKGGFIIEKSLANRSDVDQFRTSSILNLVFVIVGILGSLYFRRIQSMTAEEVDRGAVTTSDYTIIVRGLPTSETADKIKEFFEKKGRSDKTRAIVKKVNMAYEIGSYIELVRKRTKLQNKEKRTPKMDEELALIESKLKVFEEAVDNNTSANFTGIAFITFNTETETQHVIRKFRMGVFEKLIYQTFSKFLGCFLKFERTYNGKNIHIQRAPEPLDVFWENLGYDYWKLMKIRAATFISSFILIGMSFGMILGISYAQAAIKKHTTSSSLITFLSFVGSYIITIINAMIGLFMRRLAGIEKHTTYTFYFISIATKLSYAQFINTALVTLIVPWVKGDSQHLWTSDSIVSKVFFLFLLNAFMPSLLSIFNPFYQLRLWKRSRMISQGSRSKLKQGEANLLFEGPPIDMPQRYANVQKTMLFTGFYASLLPIGIVFSFVGLIVTYWTDKYLLLRRHSRPNALGKDLSEHMVDFLELFFVAFTAGNLIFEKIAREEVSDLNVVAVVIACVMLVLPQNFLTSCIQRKDNGVYNTKQYDEVKYNFVTEYDRSNPVTQDDAVREWFLEISKMSGVQMKEEEKKDLASYFQHIPKQNKFNSVANYAHTNPSFKQVQQMNSGFNFAFAPRPQPVFFAPVQANQPTPMMAPVYGQPQFRPAMPAQPIRFMNTQIQIPQQLNQFMNNAQQMMRMPFQNPQMQRFMNPFPQNQVKPPVANHFPQAQPQVITQFPAPQTQVIMQPQPQPQARPQPYPQFQGQPSPQPQIMQMNQPQVVQVNQPQMNRPPVNIQMTQQVQPSQPFANPQPNFGFQPQMQQPQNQFGMRPPQMMPQPAGQPMMQMQMNMGGPNFGMQMNQPQPQPMNFAPQQNQGNSVFGGQPGFGQRW